MKPSRFRVLPALVVLLGLVASACGTAAPAIPSPSVEPAASTPAASTGAASVEPSVDPNACTGTHSVTHVLGTTEAPCDPQRIVVLEDFLSLGVATDLGLNVVGMATLSPDLVKPPHIEGIEDTELVGNAFELDLEKIQQLEPDLIIGADFAVQSVYDQLAQIAPTLAWPFNSAFGERPEQFRAWDTWDGAFLEMADWLGHRSEYEAQLDDFNGVINEFKTRNADVLASTQVYFVRYLADSLDVFGPTFPATQMLIDAGVRIPADTFVQDPESWGMNITSEEQITKIDGSDILILVNVGFAGPADADKLLARYQANPLWATLSAVERGAVTTVNHRIWELGWNLGAYEILLEEMDSILIQYGVH